MRMITGSEGKFREASKFFPGLQRVNVDLPEIQELDPRPIIEAKLDAARSLGYVDIIVEDTSLSIDSLGGLPGPLVKWFVKGIGLDGIVACALARGGGRATAVTHVGCIARDGAFLFAEGEVEGEVVPPRGDGFGWDPIFQPSGSYKTFGEMASEEKASYSMRWKAFTRLREMLATR